jgi:hypothetical protein
MKNRIKNSCSSALVLTAVLFAATFPAAGAPLPILTIDESSSTTVTITGTGNNAIQTDGTTFANAGVDLMNFFTAVVAVGTTPASGSSLQPVSGGIVYEFWGSDTYQGATLQDLNLLSASAVSQAFVSGTPAFSGTMTINLSSYSAELPALGASGFVYPGNSGGQGTVQQPIGIWQIVAVPEPSAIALLALGAMAFAGLTIVGRARRVAARR